MTERSFLVKARELCTHNTPKTLRWAEQEARPPAFSAVQVQRPASSTLTVATSADQKCPSLAKETRSASRRRLSLRYHVT